MGKTMLRVAVVMMALLALSAAAMADLALNYEGSFNLPRTQAAFGYTDYYGSNLAFVPSGTPRPAWDAANPNDPVPGPSIVVRYSHQGHVVEYNQFPTLAKTPAELAAAGTAAGVPNTSGGTEYKGGSPSCVDSDGDFWNGGPSGLPDPNILSDPGTFVLGTNTAGAQAAIETGWYVGPGGSNYQNGGLLRLGDGAGGNLPTDGTAIDAHFITAGNLSNGPGYMNYVSDNVRTSGTTVTGSLMFTVYQENYLDGKVDVDYIRDTAGGEYVVMINTDYRSEAGIVPDGDGNFDIYVFPASTTGDVKREDFAVNIGADIAAGAGWLTDGNYGGVTSTAVDWDTHQLYVLEYDSKDARIHVFTFEGPVTPPIPEPAGLGLVGLALLAIRKRRS